MHRSLPLCQSYQDPDRPRWRHVMVAVLLFTCLLALFIGSIEESPFITNISGPSGRSQILMLSEPSNANGNELIRPSPPVTIKSCTSDYWAVLTEREQPLDAAVNGMLALPYEACIVVVALYKTSNSSTLLQGLEAHPRVVYLGQQEQASLSYGIIRALPWGHWSRKNIGYLFAIEHGAQTLLDMEGSVVLLPDSTDKVAPFTSMETQEVYPCHHLFNPYALVDGLGDLWPRGMPKADHLNPNSRCKDGNNVAQNMARLLPQQNIDIVHGLIRGSSDLSPSYSMDEGSAPGDIPDFSRWSIPRNTFIPVNALATLYRRRAFFGLMLPTTISDSMADIFRGFVTQRLAWEIGAYVAVTGPWSTRAAVDAGKQQVGRSEEEEEGDNSLLKIEALLDYLSQQWKPDGQPLSSAVEHIYKNLHDLGIMEAADQQLSQLWIKDLERVGYEVPEVPAIVAPFNQDQPRFALGVQGRASLMAQWAPVAANVEGLHLFLLSYDDPTDADACAISKVTCVPGEGTTWTVGRNRLAQAMYEAEAASTMQFKYWIFSDGEVNTLQCDGCHGDNCAAICLQEIIDRFLRSPDHNPPAIAFRGAECSYPEWDFQEIGEVDAQFNGFHRQAVPFMMPYLTNFEDISWWESQMFTYYFIETCLSPNHGIIELNNCHYYLAIQEHSNYPKSSVIEEPMRQDRKRVFEEVMGTKGVPIPMWNFPDDNARETTWPFKGTLSTWYSTNGKQWWDFYEPRMCTAQLRERFSAAFHSPRAAPPATIQFPRLLKAQRR